MRETRPFLTSEVCCEGLGTRHPATQSILVMMTRPACLRRVLPTGCVIQTSHLRSDLCDNLLDGDASHGHQTCGHHVRMYGSVFVSRGVSRGLQVLRFLDCFLGSYVRFFVGFPTVKNKVGQFRQRQAEMVGSARLFEQQDMGNVLPQGKLVVAKPAMKHTDAWCRGLQDGDKNLCMHSCVRVRARHWASNAHTGGCKYGKKGKKSK